MTSDDLIGRRVVLHPSNEKGTVRWVGNLPNQRQQRIGIELDEVDPDRHDGTFDGIKYFDTRRPKCGTFAKVKNVNFGKDLRQCLREKYQTSVEYEDSWMVGEEDVKRKLAEVDKLEYVGLEGSELATVGTLELNELTDMLTRVRELNLKDSLLHDWHEVDLLLAALPNLENLSLAGNRFNKFPEVKGEREFCGCPKLKSLDISSTLIPWSKATSYCLLGLDNLQFINLSANDYDRTVGGALPPACLTTVVMMDNQFDDISGVLQLLPTTVEKLVLCGNKLGDELPSSTPDNSAIRELSISRNDIKDWRWIGELAKALPKLMSLRITDNPIYDDYVEVKCDGSVDGATSDGPVGSAADRSRQLLISLFADLEELNGSIITNKQRIAAERYVLHRHLSCDDHSISEANTSTGGRLIDRLKAIHPYIVEGNSNQAGQAGPTRDNNIGRTLRMLKIFPLDGRQPINVRVFPSMNIADLRLLVYKRTRWPLDLDNLALQFDDDVHDLPSSNNLITLLDDSKDISNIIPDGANSTSVRPVVWEASAG